MSTEYNSPTTTETKETLSDSEKVNLLKAILITIPTLILGPFVLLFFSWRKAIFLLFLYFFSACLNDKGAPTIFFTIVIVGNILCSIWVGIHLLGLQAKLGLTWLYDAPEVKNYQDHIAAFNYEKFPVERNPVFAAFLGLITGPIGLLYTTLPGGILLSILGGIWFFLFVQEYEVFYFFRDLNILCALYAFLKAREENKKGIIYVGK